MTASTDVRTTHEVGRKARLELVFGCRNGKTVLTHGYAEPPLRIGQCLEGQRGLHLIMAVQCAWDFRGR